MKFRGKTEDKDELGQRFNFRNAEERESKEATFTSSGRICAGCLSEKECGFCYLRGGKSAVYSLFFFLVQKECGLYNCIHKSSRRFLLIKLMEV